MSDQFFFFETFFIAYLALGWVVKKIFGFCVCWWYLWIFVMKVLDDAVVISDTFNRLKSAS